MGPQRQPRGLWPAGDPSERFRVRVARLSDVGGIGRIYRGQSAESRRFFHPYPFDRVRLRALLTYMVMTHRIARTAIRWFPNQGFCLFLLEETGGAPAGFATIRFVRDHHEPGTWARFGFLVAESWQRQGGGTLLVETLYQSAMDLGVRRGGGTILASNIASAMVVAQFGFQLHATDEVDRNAPEDRNLADVRDLGPVLVEVRRRKQARIAASSGRAYGSPAAPPPAPTGGPSSAAADS
jgi:GNAT superfamily N-acetyltransferase